MPSVFTSTCANLATSAQNTPTRPQKSPCTTVSPISDQQDRPFTCRNIKVEFQLGAGSFITTDFQLDVGHSLPAFIQLAEESLSTTMDRNLGISESSIQWRARSIGLERLKKTFSVEDGLEAEMTWKYEKDGHERGLDGLATLWLGYRERMLCAWEPSTVIVRCYPRSFRKISSCLTTKNGGFSLGECIGGEKMGGVEQEGEKEEGEDMMKVAGIDPTKFEEDRAEVMKVEVDLVEQELDDDEKEENA